MKEWIPKGKGGLQLQIDGFFLGGGGGAFEWQKFVILLHCY